MSPLVKRKRERNPLPTKYLLLILTMVCVILMVLSFSTGILSGPLNAISSILVPFQKGLTQVGTAIVDRTENLGTLEEVMKENEELRQKVNELTEANTLLQQDKYELTTLRELYELDKEYDEYEKTGARIISRDPGNFYSNFVIDKGTNDGIQVDCNVIAGGGLVGRVTDVGPNFAKVVSIINDNTNTSGSVLSTGDNLIVSGNLIFMQELGVIEFSQLDSEKEGIASGDKVVTSNISDKYLPGILIGYIVTINTDSNNMTKSGTIIPVVDFKHLDEVLVITEIKENPY